MPKPQFALCVTVQVHPGRGDAFAPIIEKAAQAAEREEPGCHAFHVGRSEDDRDHFILFEVYDDAAALEYHHEQPHFKAFYEAAGEMIAAKSSVRLEHFHLA